MIKQLVLEYLKIGWERNWGEWKEGNKGKHQRSFGVASHPKVQR